MQAGRNLDKCGIIWDDLNAWDFTSWQIHEFPDAVCRGQECWNSHQRGFGMAGISLSQFPNWWILEYSPPLPLLDPNPSDPVQVSQIFYQCFLGSVLGIWAVSTFLPVVLEHPFYPKTFLHSQEIPLYPRAFLVFQIGASILFQSTSGFPRNPINPRTFPVSQEFFFLSQSIPGVLDQAQREIPIITKLLWNTSHSKHWNSLISVGKILGVELGLALIWETEGLGKVLEFQSFNLEEKPVEWEEKEVRKRLFSSWAQHKFHGLNPAWNFGD